MLAKHNKSTFKTSLGLICCLLIATVSLTTQTSRGADMTQQEKEDCFSANPAFYKDPIGNMLYGCVEEPSFSIFTNSEGITFERVTSTLSNNNEFPHKIELEGSSDSSNSLNSYFGYLRSEENSKWITDLNLLETSMVTYVDGERVKFKLEMLHIIDQ